MKLSASQWREIAKLWRDIAELSFADVAQARHRAAETLTSLLDGTHLLMVVHRRVAPLSSPAGGLRPVFSEEVGPDSERRIKLTRKWMRESPDLYEDPILRRVTDQPGTLRTIRHQEDFTDEQWSDSAVRRLLEILGVEDRINGLVPISFEVEVSFIVDRPIGSPVFNDMDKLIMDSVLSGLRPLAASFVRTHGLMPGQQALDPLERTIVDFLLSDISEPELAGILEIEEPRLDVIIDEIFRKLTVDNRVGLMSMWLEGASNGHRLAPDTRSDDLELLHRPATERVKDVLEDLPAEDFEVDVVARRLGMSVRSLQRALSKADESYSDLADAARRQRAKGLLAERAPSLTEVALRLGYEQVSSFNRAVRRWEDKTPSQWREQLHAED